MPFLSEIIFTKSKRYVVLINNLLVQFLFNDFLDPILLTYNYFYIFKKIKQYIKFSMIIDLEEENNFFTQKELNDLFELSDMDISSKYSYMAKMLFMSFFYIPIFPLGINDNNSRYLLLEIKPNLATLINQNIRIQNQYGKEIEFINGSPFLDDNNNEYNFNKINEIQECAAKSDKLIILQNLNQIQPYLYDLYNMNYKIIDEQKFVRICLENFSEQLTPVNETFRIIIFVDKKIINSVDNAY